MPVFVKTIHKLVLLFQACFAGVLLGHMVTLVLYRQPDLWVSTSFFGASLCLSLLLYIKKRKVQFFLFRYLHFNWLSFFSSILYGTILFLLFVVVYFPFEESVWMIFAVQLASFIAFFIVVAESLLLQLNSFPKIYANLFYYSKTDGFVNHLLWAGGLFFTAFLTAFAYSFSEQRLVAILALSLYINGSFFLLLVGAQWMRRKAVRAAGKELHSGPAPEGEETAHTFMVQKNYFYLEHKLKEILLESSAEERPLIYGKIRQFPLIDKIEVLEEIQAKFLPQDEELSCTLHFLHKLRNNLQDSERTLDIDGLDNVVGIKAYIRTVTGQRNPMLVLKLLNDSRPEVKKAAVLAAVNFREPSLIPALVNLLKDAEFAFNAKEVLYEFGSQCIPYLRSAKYRNKENGFLLEQCLELVASFKSNEARDFLVEMLNETQRSLQYKAALGLLKNEYPLSSLQKTQIIHLIESAIAVIAILREVSCSIEKDGHEQLHTALEEEEVAKRGLVIDLLAAFLNRPVFKLVKSQLSPGSSPDLPSLFSLIDLYFPLVLRNKCKILFGSGSGENLAKKLQAEYLHEQVYFNFADQQEAVRQVLNMDFGQIGYWLRVCALKQLAQLPAQQPSLQIISEIFNKNHLLQEVAAEVLYDLSFDYYYLYMKRLPDNGAKILRQKIETHKVTAGEAASSGSQLLYYQILFLRSLPLFKECTFESLARHISLFSPVRFEQTKRKLNFDPYKPNGYWIVFEGEFTIYHRGEPLLEGAKGDVIDMSFLIETEKDEVSLQPKAEIKIYFIEYSSFNKLYLKPLYFKKYVSQPRLNYSAKLHLA